MRRLDRGIDRLQRLEIIFLARRIAVVEHRAADEVERIVFVGDLDRLDAREMVERGDDQLGISGTAGVGIGRLAAVVERVGVVEQQGDGEAAVDDGVDPAHLGGGELIDAGRLLDLGPGDAVAHRCRADRLGGLQDREVPGLLAEGGGRAEDHRIGRGRHGGRRRCRCRSRGRDGRRCGHDHHAGRAGRGVAGGASAASASTEQQHAARRKSHSEVQHDDPTRDCSQALSHGGVKYRLRCGPLRFRRTAKKSSYAR